jgi:hypothetical protein
VKGSAVAVKHHAAVSTGGVGTDKIVTGIFVGHYFFVYIIHRVQGDLIALTQQGTAEILQYAER